MAESLAIDLRGETLRLQPWRAVHWPAQDALLIADLHLGKGDALRAAGIAVPSGGSVRDLQRLDTLLQSCAAGTLYVLGDLLHGPVVGDAWRAAWQDWRARHPFLRVIAISGNHDRRLAQAGLALELAGDSLRLGPLLLSHTPRRGEHGVVCGHLHPVVRLPRIAGRQPVFVQRPDQLILPAFSLFTGGKDWLARPEERLFVCTDDRVIALPPGTPRGRRG